MICAIARFDPQPTSELREPKGFSTPLRTDTPNRYHALS
jgi:hypothetical protein